MGKAMQKVLDNIDRNTVRNGKGDQNRSYTQAYKDNYKHINWGKKDK